MCGIAGYVGETSLDPTLLRSMCEVLRHRGPDDDGYLVQGKAALGMRRLAIIDLETGRQPAFNEDRSVALVYNGETYNYPELRSSLEGKGHRFATNTDTECIVHLYEDFKDSCVEHLRGMFAFALWDADEERLLLARDRVGKKPLFYRVTDKGVWFASELKALLQDPGFERRIDLVALHHYLTYGYVPAPWSIFEGVRKLPPAHILTYQKGKVTVRPYWKLNYGSKIEITEDDAVERLRALLLEATGYRLLSDRPVGAFLSGGLDSSLVVASMAVQMSQPVRTFSIGFDEQRFDETPYARMVAARFDCEHHEFVVRPSAMEVLPLLAWHYDEPFADSSAIPSYYLAKLTQDFVTVALNGDGGDESFAGYRRHLGGTAVHRWADVLRPVGRLAPLAKAFSRVAPPGLKADYVWRSLEALRGGSADLYASILSCFQNEEKESLYTEDLRMSVGSIDSWELIRDLMSSSDGVDPLDQLLDCDVRSYLPGDLLVKMDIATMANSLEARSPFLDHHLMEFAASLPSSLKLRGGTKKYLLKKLGRGFIPDEVLDRPKMGFAVPVGKWLSTELREMSRDLLLDGTATGRGFFQASYVERLLDQHDAGINHGARLWALLLFELWHRTFIDNFRVGQVPPAPDLTRSS